MADPRAASIQTQPVSPASPDNPGYGPTTRRPSNPRLGFLYYDTSIQLEVVFTERGWLTVGALPTSTVGAGTTTQRLALRPQPGFLFLDSTLQQEYVWTGARWLRVSPPDWVLTFSPDAPAVPMVGGGTTQARPTNPITFFHYFDTTLQRLFVWNGSSWVEIGGGSTVIPPPSANPPAITSPNSVLGTVGSSFLYQITATNTPTSYGLTGSLPTGLSFSGSTGKITGTPTVTFNSTVSITATNGSGTSSPVTLTIVVNSSSTQPPPQIISPGSSDGSVGIEFDYQIVATGNPTSYSCDSTTALAAIGLTFNTSVGQLHGVPSSTFSGTVTFGATNSVGTGTLPVTLTITPQPVTAGRFSQAQAVMWCNEGNCTAGVTVAESTASVLQFFFQTVDFSQFPPGASYGFFDPNGQMLRGGDIAGQSLVTDSVEIALAGGYTLVVTGGAGASSFVVSTSLLIVGSKFSNCSANATIVGASIAPPQGLGIALSAQLVDTGTQLASASAYELDETGNGGFAKGDLLALPASNGRSYLVTAGGTNNNPAAPPAGITSYGITALANGSTQHRVILEING